MKPELISIKLKNFKSYGNETVIGPFDNLNGITGSNGSGKSNLIDAFVFLNGGNMNEINCQSLTDLFTSSVYSKKISETKVAVLFCDEKVKKKFTRIVDENNYSEFFLNEIKVSFGNFFKTLKKFGLLMPKDFFLIKNPLEYRPCKNSSYLSKLIDKVSGSTKLSTAHLRAIILKKKLEENCSFYFNKIKLVVKEKKTIMVNKRKIFLIEKNDRIKTILNKNYKFILRFVFLHQNVKKSRKLFFIIRETRECMYQKKTIEKFVCKIEKKSNFSDKQKKVFKNILFSKKYLLIIWKKSINYLKIIQKFFFKKLNQAIAVYQIPKDELLIKKTYLKKNKKLFIKYIYLTQVKKSKHFFKIKIIKGKNFMKIYEQSDKKKKEIVNFLKIKNHRIISGLKACAKIYQCKKKYQEIQNKIQNTRAYFFTITLVSYLIETHKKREELPPIISKDKKFVKQRAVSKSRGKIRGLFKPLDSKCKLLYDNSNLNYLDALVIDERYKLKSISNISKNKILPSYEFFTVDSANCDNDGKYIPFKMIDFDFYDNNAANLLMKRLRLERLILPESDNNFSNLKANVSRFNGISLVNFKSNYPQKNKKNHFVFEKNHKKRKFLEYFFKKEAKQFQDNFRKSKKNIENYMVSIISISNIKPKPDKTSFYLFEEVQTKYYDNLHIANISEIFFNKVYFFEKSTFDTRQYNQFILSFSPIKMRCLVSKILKCFFNKNSSFNGREFSWMKNQFIFLYHYNDIRDFLIKYSIKTILKEEINYSRIIFESSNLFLQKFFKNPENLFLQKNLLMNKLRKYVKNIINNKKVSEAVEKDVNFHKLYNLPFYRLFEKLSNQATSRYECNPTKRSNYYVFLKFSLYNNVLFKHLIRLDIRKNSGLLDRNKQKILSKKIHTRIILIDKRVSELKKKMTESRKNYFILNNKLIKIKNERKTKFLKFFIELTKEFNYTYKEMTKSKKNQFGGTAFIDLSNKEHPYFGKLTTTSIPPGKTLKKRGSLSSGEKATENLGLFFALVQILKTPFVFLDETDIYFDLKVSKKFFNFIRAFSFFNNIRICAITFKTKFFLFFDLIFWVNKINNYTQIYLYSI